MAEPTVDMLPPEITAWGNEFFGSANGWSAIRQSGGINNHVYLCKSADEQVIVKSYPQLTQPQPDRFRAEQEFLTYANTCAPGYVPRLLSADTSSRILVMQYLEGTPYSASDTLEAQDIQHAASLITALSADVNLAKSHITQRAADGFLSLSEHLENITSRLAGMATSHLPGACQGQARGSLKQLNELNKTTQTIVRNAIKNGLIEDAISEDMLCPSPSDFGFHNAISCSSNVKFIDFEFAGWDDPAKVVCDFFLQPRVRVPTKYQYLIEESVATVVPAEVLRARIRYLHPVLHLKWAAIILSVLKPERLQNLLDIDATLAKDAIVQERLDTFDHYLQNGALDGIR